MLRGLFRNKTFDNIFDSTMRQGHLYGINCKLSGSVYVASEIEGAVPLIHGPRGCAFHHRLNPRKLSSPIYDFPCTDLEEEDVIYGGEEKLRKKIILIYRRYNPSLIVILPTCISGLIGDNIPGVIEDMKSEIPCDFVYAPSEGFAHRSGKVMETTMKDAAKSLKNPSKPTASELRGCGHQEMMSSLVDQLMEGQNVSDNLINLEAFGKNTYRFQSEMKEMSRLLGEMGIGINATLPSCTVKDIKKAPAAKLNVVVTRNVLWADTMKRKFGTEYIKKWFFYIGFDNAEKFFLELASKLGCEGKAEMVMMQERKEAQNDLSRCTKFFKKHDFALYSQSVIFNPHLLNIYIKDLQIPLKYLFVDLQPLAGMEISEETTKMMVENVKDMVAELDPHLEIVTSPKASDIFKISKKVDYLLSDLSSSQLGRMKSDVDMIDLSSVSNGLLFNVGFRGIVEFGRYLNHKLSKGYDNRNRTLIISRFDYDPRYGNMLANGACSASRAMWKEF